MRYDKYNKIDTVPHSPTFSHLYRLKASETPLCQLINQIYREIIILPPSSAPSDYN